MLKLFRVRADLSSDFSRPGICSRLQSFNSESVLGIWAFHMNTGRELGEKYSWVIIEAGPFHRIIDRLSLCRV